MGDVATAEYQSGGQVARPLRVLVPLIKEDLEKGREASERAGMPYYRAAGEKMLEAKSQMRHGEFSPWVHRHFSVSMKQAALYMSFARTTASIQNGAAADEFASLRDFRRRVQGHAEPTSGRVHREWAEAFDRVIDKVDVETLNLRQAELKRSEEREAQRKLALQLIDIGYKALATKLHPDKGGSRDAMSRLNQVRDRLKQHA